MKEALRVGMHAANRGAFQSSDSMVDGAGACQWWLRSPGDYSGCASYVNASGIVGISGWDVDSEDFSIRPVICVLP